MTTVSGRGRWWLRGAAGGVLPRARRLKSKRFPLLCIALALALHLPGGLAAGGTALPDGWTTTTADRLRVHHRQEDAGWAATLLRDATPVRRRFYGLIGPEAGLAVEVVLLPSRHEGDTIGAPQAPEWASGFTVSGSNVLFIRLDTLGVYPDRDLTSIFAHELGHAVFGHLSGEHQLPRWFEEGACMVLARPWDLRDSMTLTLAVLFHTRQPFDRYAAAFPEEAGAARAAYARSFSFISWLVDRHGGLRRVVGVSRRVGRGASFSVAFTLEYGMTPEQAARLWHASIGRWYRIASVVTASTTFWLGVIVLLTLGALRKRRRTRATLERWDREEGHLDIPRGPIEPS